MATSASHSFLAANCLTASVHEGTNCLRSHITFYIWPAQFSHTTSKGVRKA